MSLFFQLLSKNTNRSITSNASARRRIYTRTALFLLFAILALILSSIIIAHDTRTVSAHTTDGTDGPTLTCAQSQGNHIPLCEKQDPMLQHCAQDARSLLTLPVFDRGILLGEVNLRYSPLCKTYWVRSMAYGSAVQSTSNGPVTNIEATTTFDTTVQDNENHSITRPDGSLVIWSKMTMYRPTYASGVFDLSTDISITCVLIEQTA